MIKLVTLAIIAGVALSAVSYTDARKAHTQNLQATFNNLSARNLERAYYTVLLKEKTASAPKNACEALSALNAKDVISQGTVYSFVGLKNELGCKIDIKQTFKEYFKKSLKTDNLADITALLFATHKDSITDKEKVKDQCSKIAEYINADGLTKGAKRGEAPTAANTIVLLDALDICASLGFKNLNVEGVQNGLKALLSNAKNIQPGVMSVMDGNYLATTADAVRYALALNASVSDEHLGYFAKYLDQSKNSLDNPRSAYAFLKVAKELNAIPIIRLVSSTIKKANPTNIAVHFFNVKDGQVTLAKDAKVVGTLYDSDKQPVLENVKFHLSNSQWVGDFGKDVKAGNYKVKITVENKGKTYIFREPLTVTGVLKLSSVLFDISKSQGIPEQPPSNEVKFGKTFQGELKATQNNFIHVQFKINSDAPKIRFPSVRLINRQHQYATGPVTAIQAKDSNTFNAIIDLGDPDHVLPYTGKYDIELALTSDLFEKNIIWKFAEINISFVKNVNNTPARDGDTLMLQEIEHQFPGERKKANPMITTVFVGLLGFSLVVFLGTAFGKGNFGFLPTDFFGFIINIAFLVVLGGLIGILVLFWTHINLFETLSLLLIATIPTLIIGNMALSRINRPE